MADKVPVKATFDAAGDADGLAEFQVGETVGYTHGGTGLSALGTAGQVIKVNAGADALEWGTIAGDIEEIVTASTSGLSGGAASGTVTLVLNITGLTDGTGITVDNSNDLLIVYDNDTSTIKKINPSQLSTGGGTSVGLILALG